MLIWRYGDTDLAKLTALDLALLGLAAFRAIHLITYDKIFDIVRAAFMDGNGARLKTAERGWRRLMCEFIPKTLAALPVGALDRTIINFMT